MIIWYVMSDVNEKTIKELYLVLRNCEEQYSLWFASKEIPATWSTVFGPESKEKCLKYINETWIDMRPLSLRERMDYS